MNVTCNKCSKKYVIADDKVAGKASVKIRCKQCQNLIVVQVPASASATAPAAQASGPSAAGPSAVEPAAAPTNGAAPPARQEWEQELTRASPAVDLAASWYAMVGGKQQGPFDALALQARVGAGEVTLRTYLWKPGMTDWKRANEVPEVSSIFAGVPVAPAAAAPAPSAAMPAAGGAGPGYASSPSGVIAAEEVTEAPAPAPAPNTALADLFSDVSGPHLAPVKDSSPAPAPATAPLDPFAQLPSTTKPGEAAAAPGEATKFFIARAGVNKRNPPWKIALFVAGGVGIPVLIGWLLNTFGIVQLPTVTRTTEDGQEVQESFFSPGGLSGVRDALTGEARRKREEAAAAQRQREAVLARAAAQKSATETPAGESAPDAPPPPPRPSNPDLAALYGDDTRTISGPKVRKDDEAAPTAVNTSGLSQDAAMKVVGAQSKAFQTCVETALHRNPNLAVGNITIVLNVARSGAVTAAEVQPEKHRDADWAQCMVKAGKRIVFPTSDGETQLELPFKVGVAITP